MDLSVRRLLNVLGSRCSDYRTGGCTMPPMWWSPDTGTHGSGPAIRSLDEREGGLGLHPVVDTPSNLAKDPAFSQRGREHR